MAATLHGSVGSGCVASGERDGSVDFSSEEKVAGVDDVVLAAAGVAGLIALTLFLWLFSRCLADAECTRLYIHPSPRLTALSKTRGKRRIEIVFGWVMADVNALNDGWLARSDSGVEDAFDDVWKKAADSVKRGEPINVDALIEILLAVLAAYAALGVKHEEICKIARRRLEGAKAARDGLQRGLDGSDVSAESIESMRVFFNALAFVFAAAAARFCSELNLDW